MIAKMDFVEDQNVPLLNGADKEGGLSDQHPKVEDMGRGDGDGFAELPANATFFDRVKFAFSKRNKSRKRNIAIAVFLFTCILTTITLLVILPQVVQSMVDNSKITILQTSMSYPTNTSFSSEVTQTFSHTGGMPVKSTMHDVSLYWHNPDTNEDNLIAKLSQFEEIDIEEGVEVNMRSKATIANEEPITTFNSYAQNQEKLHWRIKGKADLTTSYLPGMSFTVDLDKKMDLSGFNGFPQGPVTHMSNTTGGTSTTLYNKAFSTFYSAADIAIYFKQDLHMDMSYNGVKFGVGTIKDAELLPGASDCLVNIEMSPKTNEEWNAVASIVSNYAIGANSEVTLGPFFVSNTISWLKPSLSAMSLKTIQPGSKDRGIIQTDMYPAKKLSPLQSPFTLTMYNPVDATYTVTSMHSKIYSNGILLATVTEENLNIVIAPRATIVTLVMHSKAEATSAAAKEYDAMKNAGFGYVDIVSDLQVKIGDFVFPDGVRTLYNQDKTLAVVHSDGP